MVDIKDKKLSVDLVGSGAVRVNPQRAHTMVIAADQGCLLWVWRPTNLAQEVNGF